MAFLEQYDAAAVEEPLRPGVKPDADLGFGGTPYPQHSMMSWNGNGAGSMYA